MQLERETIFALSSGAARAGVAVIRVSGPRAFAATTQLCGALPDVRKAALRKIRDPQSGAIIDEGLILVFPAPHSFTGEDCTELQVHGSLAVIRSVLGLLARVEGLRPAEPGEFTRRAWLGGKLDLLQVEALGDLLQAETELQRRLAVQGSTRFRTVAETWRAQLLDLRARVEAEIDFADEGDVLARLDSATERDMQALADAMTHVLRKSVVGERVRRGFRVAVLGPPNAGKSTLVNALASRDVMITSPVPGTTRDAVEVLIDLDGLPVVLVDTAGMRETHDAVEREGIRRSERVSDIADLVLWLSPANDPSPPPNTRFVCVTTKMDLVDLPDSGSVLPSVSALTGDGVEGLITFLRLQGLNGQDDLGTDVMLAHERQRDRITQCVAALERLGSCAQQTLDMKAEELRQACDALEELIGRVRNDDVLDIIFSRFCIGK